MIKITEHHLWNQWLNMALSLDRIDPVLTLEAIGPSIFAAGQAEEHQRALEIISTSGLQQNTYPNKYARGLDKGANEQLAATIAALKAAGIHGNGGEP